MGPKTVRRGVVAVCVVGIAGMIVGSVADNNGVALTFGLMTAAAAVCLIVASAVAGPTSPPVEEALAEHVEGLVGDLVASGADEAVVRRLVADAVRLGRGGHRP